MEIRIKIDSERILHIANDHFDHLNYVDIWVTRDDDLEVEAIAVPIKELCTVIGAFEIQWRENLNNQQL